MAQLSLWVSLTVYLLLAFLCPTTSVRTDPLEVSALQELYKALNYPSQLKGWKKKGGDPCEESWKGISCSGSSVILIQLHGLRLGGNLGGQLSNLLRLKELDVSSNKIQGEIPSSLPPNATHLNLACNSFSQDIPYSLTSLKLLHHLNLSHNSLSGPIGNVFTGLQSLRNMDLSYNNFTGNLPTSFGDLKNLTKLFLQNNQFTGSVIFLANLPLFYLNIQNNHFGGVIPEQFQFIPKLWIGGNRFYKGANYPAWNFPLDNLSTDPNINRPPTTQPTVIESYPSVREGKNKHERLGPGGTACMVGGGTLLAVCAVLVVAVRIKPSCFRKLESLKRDDSSFHSLPMSTTGGTPAIQFVPLPPHVFSTNPRPRLVSNQGKWTDVKLKQQQKLGVIDFSSDVPVANSQSLACSSPPTISSWRILSVRHSRTERGGRRSFSVGSRCLSIAKRYTLAEIQAATNSFSEENILGEGSLGSVYKAEFPDGQILAVRSINMVAQSLSEEEQFLDVIWKVGHLRHPNVMTLLGYCMEHGQHLLVYEYIGHLSLDDVLHSDTDKPLSWSLRVRIALGIARALDYLHTSCFPPCPHCNLKAANILLDDDFMPRLCDCGLAILRPLGSNTIKASEMAIPFSGYITPEHGQPRVDAKKIDIYAFGILLLELLTGRKPLDSSRASEEQCLVTWASSHLHHNKSLEEMIDPTIKRVFPSKVLFQFADIISLCIQPDPELRPSMSEIVDSLVYLSQRMSFGKRSLADGTEVEASEISFLSADTRFISSPVMSHASI